MKTLTKRFATLLAFLFLGLAFLAVNASAQTGRGAGVSLDTLPKELRDLGPRDNFISSSQKKVGVIHALEGKVVVIHRATKEAYFAVEGDPVFEDDSLNTLAESRCRIRLLDEDVITMAPDTEFNVDSFQDQRAEGKKTSLFTMAKGKAMFYAMRLFRYKETRFNVNTPTVTVGVRGTKFGVEVVWKDGKTAQAGVRVADSTNEIGPYLAQLPPGGGQSFTNAHSEDGFLNVAGLIVPPGQMFNGLTGNVIPTPPSVIRSFNQATGMGAGRGQVGVTPGGGEEGDTGGPVGGVGGVPTVPETFTITQIQTGAQTTKGIEEVDRGPKDIGYFSAMLTWGGSMLEEVFVQFDAHKQYSIDPVTGRGLSNQSNLMEGVPNFENDSAYLSRLYLPLGGGDSGSLGTSRPINDTLEGANAYMRWGYWTMTTPVVIGGNSYTVNNRGYYVVGEATWDVDRVRSLGNVAYSGNAWGTYFSGAGGTNMTGSFGSNVNMNNGAISNFNLSVSGGGKSASITNATGTIYNNLQTKGCTHFEISPTSGTWTLSPASGTNYTASYKGAAGTLYGPNAEHIGGVWGMKYDSSNGAAGNFVGTR